MAIFVLYVGSSIGSLRLERQEIHCISPWFYNYHAPGNAGSPKLDSGSITTCLGNVMLL